MKTRQTIFIIAMCALFAGCNVDDGKVKYHFNPPMSYHTLTFDPVSLSASVAKTYSPRGFFKIDKRFRAVRANFVVQATDKAMRFHQATNILAGAVVAVAVLDSNKHPMFTNASQIISLPYRVKQEEPLVITFGFPGSPFTPKEVQLGSAVLSISIPEGAKGTERFTAYLEFTEIRGK
jgi:hypothetical protein